MYRHCGLDGPGGDPERALQREGGHLVLRGLCLGAPHLRDTLQERGQLGHHLGRGVQLTPAPHPLHLPRGDWQYFLFVMPDRGILYGNKLNAIELAMR